MKSGGNDVAGGPKSARFDKFRHYWIDWFVRVSLACVQRYANVWAFTWAWIGVTVRKLARVGQLDALEDNLLVVEGKRTWPQGWIT